MIKPNHKSTKEPLKSQEADNNKSILKKNFFKGSIIATIIASSPFLFYVYEFVPSDKIWNTFLFTYNSGFYENARTAMWMLSGKVIPLFFLIIWFFTNRHWWYHALLVPIVMYIYQIVDAIVQDTSLNVDKFQLVYFVPVMAVIIPSIYLIRAKMFNKINNADKTMEQLEEEFMFKPKGIWDRIRDYF